VGFFAAAELAKQVAVHDAAKVPVQMIALGLVVLGAYIGGRITKRLRMSDVTGQMLGGALMGPYALHTLGIITLADHRYDDALYAFNFFVFVFLCLIAFGIGEELHVSRLRKVGWAAVIISFVHCVITFSLIAVSLYIFSDLSTLKILLLSSIGITSAPAISFVMLNQMRIEGHLRHITGGVLVLTDLLGVLLFSLFMQLCQSESKGLDMSAASILGPVVYEVGLATAIGVGVYIVLRILVRREAAVYDELSENKNFKDQPLLVRLFSAHPSPSVEILMITIAAISIGTGIAYWCHLPFLVTAVVAGFLVANRHSFAIFDSLKIDNIAPIFNLLFFALVGASMTIHFDNSKVMTLAGIYILMRTVGKIAGTWIGCKVAGEDRKVVTALPSQLLPQTGVAAVEAVYMGQVLNNPELSGVILPGIVFFGVFGVIKVERALRKYLKLEEEEVDDVREKGSPLSEAARRLLAYLSPESVILDLKGTTKFEVIEEMIDKARAVSPHHIDREQAIQVVNERERLAPTGVGHGIALPHCRLIGLDEPVLILGRHEKGVVFGGIDEEPCSLILLIITSGRNPSEHLHIMASAAHVFNNPVIRHNLKSAATSELLMLSIIEIAEQKGGVGGL